MALQHLDHYEILDRLGEGFVYKARDRRSGEVVAIKVHPAWMRSSEEFLARFEREIKAEQSIRHANVAGFMEVGATWVDDPELVGSAGDASGRAAVVYLVREFVEGEKLRTILAGGALPLPQALDIASQIARGLESIHARGMVLRNLNSDTVRINADGQIKLFDFGLVRILEDQSSSKAQQYKTAVGQLMGTAPYLAPEQVMGDEADARTDLFALGILLYQMISGEMPFPHRNLLEYFHAVREEEPAPLSQLKPEVDPALEAVVSRLLAKPPDQRYQSAAELLDDLSAAAAGG